MARRGCAEPVCLDKDPAGAGAAARAAGLSLWLGSAAACLQLRGSAFAAGSALSGAQRSGAAPSVLSRASGAGGHALRASEQRRTEAPRLAVALASLCGAGAVCCADRSSRRSRSSRVVRLVDGGVGSVDLAPRPDFTKTRKSDDDDVAWDEASTDWEIDCFSRPIVRDGKKVWELMVTDANAVYRRVAQMKPTRVNSVVVQKLLTIFIEEAKVKPKSIRFYRKVMKNMLVVALTGVKESIEYMADTKIIPSRNCHMLRLWLDYREREVYPKMDGFSPAAKRRAQSVKAASVQVMYPKLPKKLSFAAFNIASIPLASFMRMPRDNVRGSMCRVPAGFADTQNVYGLVLQTPKPNVLCAVLRSMELAAVRLNPDTNEMLMDFGMESTYTFMNVDVEDKETMLEFERGKRAFAGFHFVAVSTGQGRPSLPVPEGEELPDGAEGVFGLWTLMDYAPMDDA